MPKKISRKEYEERIAKGAVVVSEVPLKVVEEAEEFPEEPLQEKETVVDSPAFDIKDVFYKTVESQDLLIATVERVLGSNAELTKELTAALRRPQVQSFTMVTPEGQEYQVNLKRG